MHLLHSHLVPSIGSHCVTGYVRRLDLSSFLTSFYRTRYHRSIGTTAVTSASMAKEPSAHETRAALDERRQRLLKQLQQAVEDERLARAAIDAVVEDLRVLNLATWADIGRTLGISGQAAYQRYGKRLPGRPN